MAGAKFLVVFLVVFSVLVQNGWSAAVPEGKTDVSGEIRDGNENLVLGFVV